ncbi:hypothetical protein [Pseudomonas gessardii]|uniref:Uncharacterized protein n=1 Tax=Pseudomonas gessardii TaxID=78544 RepID=A0A7Y1MRH4_9PSED|nr:hypothetical protein [Pseudomonas gessardii]NNA96926.1 hypothetical protein [Pseudomonas gessardii]
MLAVYVVLSSPAIDCRWLLANPVCGGRAEVVGLQTFATSVLAAMLPMMRLVRLFARGQHQDNGGQSEGGIWIKAAVPVARPEKHQVLSMGLVTLSRLFVQSLISFLFANPVCGNPMAAAVV